MAKYNNNSVYFKDWTTKKLKEEAKAYYSSIYQVECYGVKDLIAYEGILRELENRGYEVAEEGRLVITK